MSTFEDTRKSVKEMVLKASKLSLDAFEEKFFNHLKFLECGGAGGYWQTYYLSNLIFGRYHHSHILDQYSLKQATINYFDLSELSLEKISLSYANCMGVLCENKSWDKADLEGTLMIDSILNNCSFKEADLFATDFSRSEMRNCNFEGANLIQTDFENCDLTGSDFRGAKIDHTTSFKGAILQDVKRYI